MSSHALSYLSLLPLVGDALTVPRSLLKRVIPSVAAQERAEGTFRNDHAWLRMHAESVAFFGPEALEGREKQRLNARFDGVVAAR